MQRQTGRDLPVIERHRPLRRAGLAVLALTAGALAVYTTLWFWACARLEQGIRDELVRASQQGWSIHTGEPVRTGWPLAAAVELPSFSLAADPSVFPGGLTWTAERVRIDLGLGDREHLHVLPEGSQHIQIEGLPPLSARAKRLDLALAFDRTVPPLISADDLHADLPGWPVTLAHLAITLPPDALLLHAQGLTMPETLGRGVSPAVDSLDARAVLTKPVPAGDAPAARARAWSASGGTIELTEIALRWGGLDLSGHAAITLDQQLQPDGEGVITAVGLGPTLDGLARAGVIPTGTATAAKAVLALLAAPSPGNPVSLPLRIHDGVLTLARFPLLRLPKLDWGPR